MRGCVMRDWAMAVWPANVRRRAFWVFGEEFVVEVRMPPRESLGLRGGAYRCVVGARFSGRGHG